MADSWASAGFGLYVHWPFCAAKCPYCDFNSHVSQTIHQSEWAKAYVAEIARTGRETPDKVLNTIFFGGGTPSLMDPDVVAAVIDAARRQWRCSNDIEITLEANPGSVEAGRFAAYRAAGVNRVSLGVQALNDPDLRRLGRIHSAAEARAAFDIARTTFDRVSFDLIYGRQDQGLEQWRAELTEALNMAVDHLSLYQLTIEDGTAFGDRFRAGGLKGLPPEGLAADLYEETQTICDAHGLAAYEVSNHAVAGAESRHNLIYWRCGDYAGIGPGAHGRLSLKGRRYATETRPAPTHWLQDVQHGSGEWQRQELTLADQATEYTMMCLRLTEGLNVDRFIAITGQPVNADAVRRLQDLDLVALDDGQLRTTAAGRLVLNAVTAELLADPA